VFTEFAPAKINLSLRVLGRRADGLHLLDSLIAFADIGDRVTVRPDAKDARLRLRCVGPYAAMLGEDNLVLRAARLVQSAFAVRCGAEITLEKNLPVASGIGGGSADAAAALRALKHGWELPEGPLWEDIALRLGADVPVCLHSRTCRIGGMGEILAPASVSGYGIVLANPNQSLLTKDVFAAYAAQGRAAQGEGQAEDLHNDLEAAACGLLPVIREVRAALAGARGCEAARMSGSGATCFGLFSRREDAHRAADSIATRHPGWWVRAGRIPYEGEHGQAQ
jgi:4-diphosphocytidyl-2-C-methyl-D-erythritol kinase